MATEVVSTIASSGGDYTTLNAWHTAKKGDIVTRDTIEIADCFPMTDTTIVYLGGWTMDASHYVVVRANANHRHGGLPDSSICYYRNTSSSNIVLYGAVHIIIDGIIAKASIISGSGFTGVATIKNCVTTGGQYTAGIDISENTTYTLYVYNNIFRNHYGAGNPYAGLYLRNTTTAVVYFYNNTGYNSSRLVNVSTPYVTCKNNIAAVMNTTAYLGTFTAESTNNYSSSGTAPGTNPITAAPSFVDAANGNLHLSATDTAARGHGVNLSSDSHCPFNKDVDDVNRPSTWSIGADDDPGLSTTTGDTDWNVMNAVSKSTLWTILAGILSADIAWTVFGRASKATTWDILTLLARDTTWNFGDSVTGQMSWNILASLSKDSNWRILALLDALTEWDIELPSGVSQIEREVLWNILAAQTGQASWDVLSASTKSVAWNVLTKLGKACQWDDLARKNGTVNWNVLTLIAGEIDWNIHSGIAKATSWNVETRSASSTLWDILTSVEKDTTWTIYVAKTSNTNWDILTRFNRDANWRVLTAVSGTTTWKNIIAQGFAARWNVLTLAQKSAAWRVLGAVHGVTTWDDVTRKNFQELWNILRLDEFITTWNDETRISIGSDWRVLTVIGKDVKWHVRGKYGELQDKVVYGDCRIFSELSAVCRIHTTLTADCPIHEDIEGKA